MRRLVVLAVTALVVALASLVLPGAASAWSWPADGAVLRPFTLGSDPYAAGQHRGIDVTGVEGGPVRAPVAGSITFVGTVPTHGRTVAILTAEGHSVTIAHLGAIQVDKGQAVAEGAVIGTLGHSGVPEHAEAYIHLGVRVATQEQGYLDPMGFLPSVVTPPEPVGESASASVEASTSEEAAAVAPSSPPEAPETAPTQGLDPVPAGPSPPASPVAQAGTPPPAVEQAPTAQPGSAQPSVPTPAAEPERTEPARPSPAGALSALGQDVDAGLDQGAATHRATPGMTAGSTDEGAVTSAVKRPTVDGGSGSTGDHGAVNASASEIGAAGIRPARAQGADPRAETSSTDPVMGAGTSTSVALDGPARDAARTASLGSQAVAEASVGHAASRSRDGVAGRASAAARFADRRVAAGDPPDWPTVAVCVALIVLLTTAGAVARRTQRPAVQSIGMEPYYVTTPIYYVNSTPHVGHAYTTIAADVLVRHQRQRGRDSFFLTGVDEHASKVARVAAEQGLAPQEYADQIAEVWRALPARLNASPDFFIRTSDEGHKTFVQGFLQAIRDNGRDDIYQDTYAGLYCVGCEAFKTEEELVDGKCPEHDTEPEWIEERNWFFRLSAYQDALLELYDAQDDFVLPSFRANEARSFIAGGLHDFSISRAGQPWGIPIPWDPDQVAYVWADALVNYVSALTYARPGEDLRSRYWPAVRHLLGKDILRFHCVYWPAMLLAAGVDVPRQLFVHGYLLLDNRKISKSLGNVLNPLDLVDTYGADALRFWCARSVSFGQDGTASLAGLHDRYERELGNDLGNLLSRTTAMIARYRGGVLAAVPADISPLRTVLEPLGDDVARRLDGYDLTGALERIWEVVRALNRYVEASAPWQLAKDPDRAAELDAVLYDLADGLRVVATALAAYLPETAPEILAALHQSPDLGWERMAYGLTTSVEGIEPAPPLFPRVEAPAPA